MSYDNSKKTIAYLTEYINIYQNYIDNITNLNNKIDDLDVQLYNENKKCMFFSNKAYDIANHVKFEKNIIGNYISILSRYYYILDKNVIYAPKPIWILEINGDIKYAKIFNYDDNLNSNKNKDKLIKRINIEIIKYLKEYISLFKELDKNSYNYDYFMKALMLL